MLVMQLHYPPKYVLDEMQMYEVRAALKYSYYASKDTWEANRLTAYKIAQTHSKRRLTLQDIVTFPWENKEESDTSITKEDIERLQMKADYYLKQHKNG